MDMMIRIIFFAGVAAVGYWIGYKHGEQSSNSYMQGYKKGIVYATKKALSILDKHLKENYNEKN